LTLSQQDEVIEAVRIYRKDESFLK